MDHRPILLYFNFSKIRGHTRSKTLSKLNYKSDSARISNVKNRNPMIMSPGSLQAHYLSDRPRNTRYYTTCIMHYLCIGWCAFNVGACVVVPCHAVHGDSIACASPLSRAKNRRCEYVCVHMVRIFRRVNLLERRNRFSGALVRTGIVYK